MNLTSEALRILERAFKNEPGDGIYVHRRRFAAQTHSLKRNGAAAGKWIKNSRRSTSICLANLIAKPLNVRTRLITPAQDATHDVFRRACILRDGSSESLKYVSTCPWIGRVAQQCGH